jgi:hypothetical protein
LRGRARSAEPTRDAGGSRLPKRVAAKPRYVHAIAARRTGTYSITRITPITYSLLRRNESGNWNAYRPVMSSAAYGVDDSADAVRVLARHRRGKRAAGPISPDELLFVVRHTLPQHPRHRMPCQVMPHNELPVTISTTTVLTSTALWFQKLPNRHDSGQPLCHIIAKNLACDH